MNDVVNFLSFFKDIMTKTTYITESLFGACNFRWLVRAMVIMAIGMSLDQ